MNDLLADSTVHEFQKSNYAARDIEMGEAGSEKILTVLHSEADNFKELFQNVDDQIDYVKKLNNKANTVIEAKEVKAVRSEMETKIVDIKSLLVSIHTGIKSFGNKYCTDDAHQIIRRQGCTILNSLNSKLMAKKKVFLDYLKVIEDDQRATVKKNLFIVSGKAADDQMIDEIIKGGDVDNIYSQALRRSGAAEIQTVLGEMKQRHQQFLQLENDLLILNQTFLDMAVTVESQGDMLNNIETHVQSASKFIKVGNAGLEKSKKLQKNSRKWMCYAIIMLLLVVIVIVVGVVKPWTSRTGA